MKIKDIVYFSLFGIKTILFKKREPILGTIILTDYCNLSCKHCSVNNINKVLYPYENIRSEMEELYKDGVRILFFCGGETLLWESSGKTIKDLVKEAKEIGFLIVNLVTNGTIDLNIPGADIIFLSLDGTRERHNYIRGNTYDKIMDNVSKVENSNICVYMAVNDTNKEDIRELCEIVRENPNLNSISFNFHTPYEKNDTLVLSKGDKSKVVDEIKELIKEGYPIFNLSYSLDRYLLGDWKRPCYQCVVVENGKRFICGRCVEIEGLCEECGYLFASEFSMLFNGDPRIIFEVLKTYLKYV